MEKEKKPGFFDELKSSRKCTEIEEPIDLWFTEPVGFVFTVVARKFGVHPNAVTFVSMVCGLAGGILFYSRNIWINLTGVLLFILSIVLDATDGQLARLTHKTSELGRLLDGLSTMVGYAGAYLALGFRMSDEYIPFTGTKWGGWIWIVIVVSALFFHARQDRMADYFRNLHLLFALGKSGSELTTSESLRRRAAELKGGKPSIERLYLRFYIPYTAMQERSTPRTQEFLRAAAARDGEYFPENREVAEAYRQRSLRIVQLTNLLTINLRAYALFILLLLGLHVYYFPFLVIVMGTLDVIMVRGYEKIASDLKEKYYPGDSGTR